MEHNFGILALQGDVSEHVTALRNALRRIVPGAHAKVITICSAREIRDLDGLIIPGGESTTISRLIDANAMRKEIQEFEGGILGTCAGLVLMGEKIVDDNRLEPLGLLDIAVRRNAFGGQRESFERGLNIKGLDKTVSGNFHPCPAHRVGRGRCGDPFPGS